jgi:hypothetical protein
MIASFLFYLALLLPGSKLKTTEAFKQLHPFFVSVTQIEENQSERILEVSCRIFTDDFEKTLRAHYDRHVDLLNPQDRSAMNELIDDYIKKHLALSVDGKKVSLQFVGYEQMEEGVQCYFQVNDVTVNKTISVFNNLLFEYKPEQTNIVHVTVRHTRKSYQLINPENKATFHF